MFGIAAGSAAAQLSLLLASPVLTRLFTPRDFGIYSYFFATLGFIAPVATLRYELAVPVPARDSEGRRIAGISLVAAAAMAAVTFGVLFGLGNLGLIVALSASAFSYWFVFGLPLGVWIAGIYQTLTYWAVRVESFRAIAVARGTLGAGTGLAQIILGVFALGPPGLIAGDLVGRALASGVVAPSLGRETSSTERGSRPSLLETLREYRGFPLVSAPAALLNALALFLPLFVIGYLYGAGAAGLLFLAQRVVGLPAALMTSAASQVYVSEFVKAPPENRPPMYRSTVRRLAWLTAAPTLAGMLAAPALVPLLFGSAWATAGWLGTILAPFYFVQLLSGATIVTLDVSGHHGERLLREVILLGLTVVVLGAGFVHSFSLLALIGLYSAAGVFFYCWSLAYTHGVVMRHTI